VDNGPNIRKHCWAEIDELLLFRKLKHERVHLKKPSGCGLMLRNRVCISGEIILSCLIIDDINSSGRLQ